MKIKVKFNQTKGRRIYRFARGVIALKTFFGGSISSEKSKYTEFIHKGETIYVNDNWETEKLKNGDICHTVSSKSKFAGWGLSFKVKTVKAAIKKILNVGKYFPTETVFESYASWIGHNVEFVIKNSEYNEEKLKEELYLDLELLESYKIVSGVDQDFDNLVKSLRNEGYFVYVEHIASEKNKYENHESYWYASVIGKNLRAGFCTKNNASYSYIDGKISADHNECFDKWSKCPIKENIPTTHEARENLLLELKYLTSDEGFEASNKFEYEQKYI